MIDGKKIISIGGTFSVLHEEHKKYIETAFEYGDEVRIFLSSDEQAKMKKNISPPILIVSEE